MYVVNAKRSRAATYFLAFAPTILRNAVFSLRFNVIEKYEQNEENLSLIVTRHVFPQFRRRSRGTSSGYLFFTAFIMITGGLPD
jgi:hypothetical protein